MLWISNPFIQSSTKGLKLSPFGLDGLPLRDLLPSAMPAMRSLLSVRPINLRRFWSQHYFLGAEPSGSQSELGKYNALITPGTFLDIYE